MSYRDSSIGGTRTCPECEHEVPDGARYCPYCRSPMVAAPGGDPFIGTTLQGRYFIEARLGAGGMGTVYRGIQHRLDRAVAIKVLNPTLLSDPSFVQRFKREARAASKLHHPNVITVTDFGQLENGTLFMVMDLVRGRNLLSVIKDEFPLEESRVVHIASQILSALAEAHQQGIVHRDLKPENVMLESRLDDPDVVRVLDFGIAKIRDPGDEDGGLTRPGFVFGTPAYMSPEQALGGEIDPRSDLYSVGVILFQLLTGKLPFDAPNSTEMIQKVLTAPIPPLLERAPSGATFSPALEAVVLKALQKKPEDRFASALEMRAALLGRPVDRLTPPPRLTPTQTVILEAAPASGPRVLEAPPSTPPPSTPPRGLTQPSPPAETRVLEAQVEEEPPAPPQRGRRGFLIAVAAGALLIAAAGAAWYAWPRPAEPVPAAPPTPSIAESPAPSAPSLADPPAPSAPGPTDPPPPPPEIALAEKPSPPPPPAPAPTERVGGETSPAGGQKASAGPRIRVLKKSEMIGMLEVPSIATGEGILAVTADVVGRVYVDRQYVADTPVELRLPARKYQLRFQSDKFGRDGAAVEVRSGKRVFWRPEPKK